ncbi:hypothetical protein AOLI_G00197900 [Acnodon oligacanthus]
MNRMAVGFASLIPRVQANKNVDWINYIYYNQQRLANYAKEALLALGEQLHATTQMAFQSQVALDMLLVEKGRREYNPYDPDSQTDLDPKPDYLGDDMPQYPDSDEEDSMG